MLNIEWIANQIIKGYISYNKAIIYIESVCANKKEKINELDNILKIKGFAKLVPVKITPIKKEDE